MIDKKRHKVIGLMSGTSLDGVDAALIETDGETDVVRHGFCFLPYSEDLKERLRAVLGKKPEDEMALAALAQAVTEAHAAVVAQLLAETGTAADDIDLIGFHGQTIYHAPADGITVQIGDGALLSKLTGIAVVNDFRTADVAAGGQGAPLVPVYHRALVAHEPAPLVILNLGGVGNITYIGADGALVACDTGPANALIDDWMLKHTGVAFDDGGKFAMTGNVDEDALAAFLADPYFALPPPKSLDRDHFKKYIPAHLSPEDGAATLTAFTVHAVAAALRLLPQQPVQMVVCGGGRKNAAIMDGLTRITNMAVINSDALGWNGDAIEAEAFAYLAVRSVDGKPCSFPETTGVSAPMTGGMLHKVLGLKGPS